MYKVERLSQEVLKTLYMIKTQVDELNDFFLNFTYIDVAPNAKSITCYYKTSPENKENIINYFKKNTLYIKHLLLQNIKMRRFPNIKFIYQS